MTEAVPSSFDQSPSRVRWGWICGGVIVFLMAWLVWYQTRPLSPRGAERLLELATLDLDNGINDTAYEYLQTILANYPDHQEARRLLAITCVNQRRPDELGTTVAGFSDRYLHTHFDESWGLARFMTSFGFLYEAQPLLERLNSIRPAHQELRNELLRCYRISGRNAFAAPLLCQNVTGPKQSLSDLLMLTATRLHWVSADDIRFMKQVGQRHMDLVTQLGYARREVEDGNTTAGISVLEQVVQRKPDWELAYIRLALAHWSAGHQSEWTQSAARWDLNQLKEADGWFLLGYAYQESQEHEVSLRCIGEALARDPKHLGAWTQLPAVLHATGLSAEATLVSQHAQHLANLDQYCQNVSHQATPEAVLQLVHECAAIGWTQLAQGWTRYGRVHWPDGNWPDIASEGMDDLTSFGLEEDPLLRLVSTIHYRQFPLPQTALPHTVKPPSIEPTGTSATANWLLEDDAASLGIQFRYENGLDPQRDRAYMFEFAGPGLGVIDYDRDGWADLHITQGARWPVNESNTSLRDELFRNQGDGRFTPVAAIAGTAEPGYSQGPAVGDYDSDGFPDLYVCNIGPNRCYRNNGDGTFSEVTNPAGVSGNDWSISAAWADFNGDGLSDLYVVNYLAGDVYERSCRAADGRPVQCPPMQFPGAKDQLFLNAGDGSFADVSTAAGIALPDGKGMGILVGRFCENHPLNVFIANDTTANFFFTNRTVGSSIPRFEEQAALIGVAFGPQGNAQSSMGIAAGDLNRDGRTDLFVTNWLAESPNLFLLESGCVFNDQASRFGLTGERIQLEGWGTQFVDVDADGHLDLFVANGHLEENDAKANRMPPHLFHNENGRRLTLVSDSSVGAYFDGKYLGRSVVVWDWNRDGRQDLAVSHTTDPVAVLSNRTAERGHRIALRLIGVRSARDPVGTRIKVQTGDAVLMQERVSGDGYAASNEELVYFGIGDHSSAVQVVVDWPSGHEQVFAIDEVDAAYVLIEDQKLPLRLHRLVDNHLTAVRSP